MSYRPAGDQNGLHFHLGTVAYRPASNQNGLFFTWGLRPIGPPVTQTDSFSRPTSDQNGLHFTCGLRPIGPPECALDGTGRTKNQSRQPLRVLVGHCVKQGKSKWGISGDPLRDEIFYLVSPILYTGFAWSLADDMCHLCWTML